MRLLDQLFISRDHLLCRHCPGLVLQALTVRVDHIIYADLQEDPFHSRLVQGVPLKSVHHGFSVSHSENACSVVQKAVALDCLLQDTHIGDPRALKLLRKEDRDIVRQC